MTCWVQVTLCCCSCWTIEKPKLMTCMSTRWWSSYHLGKKIGLWERKSALQMKWNARINEECSKNGSFDSSVGSVWASPFHFGGQVMEWWFLMHMLGSGLSRSLLLVLWFLVLQSLVEVLFRCDQPPSASQLVRLNHSYMVQTPGWDPVRLTWLRFELGCLSFLGSSSGRCCSARMGKNVCGHCGVGWCVKDGLCSWNCSEESLYVKTLTGWVAQIGKGISTETS